MRYVPLGHDASAGRDRPPAQMRSLFVKAGVSSRADGSAYVESERLKVVAAVYGPRATNKAEYNELAELRCDVKLATFAQRERKVPGQTEEEKAWSLGVQQALEAAVLLHKYPKAVVDVHVLVLEADGSVLAAALNAASLALANAGIEMRDLVTAATVGVGAGGPLLDLNCADELAVGGGLTVAALGSSGEVVQMHPLRDSVMAVQGLPLLVTMALEACAHARAISADALKN